MPLTDVLTVRKAVPIMGFASTVDHRNGRVHCVIRYAVGNGTPICAVLLPVMQDGGRWVLRDRNGPVAQPQPEDVTVVPGSVANLEDQTAEVDVPLPPVPARQALLLLLHDQIVDVGEDLFRKRLQGHLYPQLLIGLESSYLSGTPPAEGPCTQSAVQDAVCYCMRHVSSGELDSAVLSLPAAPAAPATAAAERGTSFVRRDPKALPGFALTSCLYPAGMLDSTVRRRNAVPDACDFGPAHRPLWRLAERCRAGEEIAAVILAGDQVYVDATAGLFDAQALADGLRVAYDRLARHPAFNRILGAAPAVLPLMDDHEIHENWDGDQDKKNLDLETAKGWYLKKQRSLWPMPPAAPVGTRLWDSFALAGFDFFFADTRTEREKRTHRNWSSAPIYGSDQAEALMHWIQRCAGERPAFVVSPAMLVPRMLMLRHDPVMALHVDAWPGFPRSFQELLVWLYDACASNVVFLSGDEHLSCIARITIAERGSRKLVQVYSVHSSAAYAPFVFANARPEDFADGETFGFCAGTRKFVCKVRVTAWRPGDGFALITPLPATLMKPPSTVMWNAWR